MSDSEYEEEERTVLMLDFQGVIDGDAFLKDQKSLKILGIETEQPIVQVGPNIFSGHYEDTMGTVVFFGKDGKGDGNTDKDKPSDQYQCLHKTDKKLVMKRAFLEEKTKNKETEPQASTSANHRGSYVDTEIHVVPSGSADFCNGNVSQCSEVSNELNVPIRESTSNLDTTLPQQNLQASPQISNTVQSFPSVAEATGSGHGNGMVPKAGENNIASSEVDDSVGSSEVDFIVLSEVEGSNEASQDSRTEDLVASSGHRISDADRRQVIRSSRQDNSSSEVSNSTPSTSQRPQPFGTVCDSVAGVLHDVLTDIQELHGDRLSTSSDISSEPMDIADSASFMVKSGNVDVSESLLPLICDSASSEIRIVRASDEDDLESGTSEAMDTTEGKEQDVGPFFSMEDAEASQISTSESTQCDKTEAMDTSQNEVSESNNVGSTEGEPIDLSYCGSNWVNEGIESSSTLVTDSSNMASSSQRLGTESRGRVNSTVAEAPDVAAKGIGSSDSSVFEAGESSRSNQEEVAVVGNASGSIDSTTNNVIRLVSDQKDNNFKSTGIDSTTNESGNARKSYVNLGNSSVLKPNESIDSTMNIFKPVEVEEEVDFEMREAKNLSGVEETISLTQNTENERVEENQSIDSTSGSVRRTLSASPINVLGASASASNESPSVSTICEVTESCPKRQKLYTEDSSDSDSDQCHLVISYPEDNDNFSACRVTESNIDENACTHSSDVKPSLESNSDSHSPSEAVDCRAQSPKYEVTASSSHYAAHLGGHSLLLHGNQSTASPCEVSESCASSSKTFPTGESESQSGDNSVNLVSESLPQARDDSPQLIIDTDSSPYAVTDSTNISYSTSHCEEPLRDFARSNEDSTVCEVTESSLSRTSSNLNAGELSYGTETVGESSRQHILSPIDHEASASVFEVAESSDRERHVSSNDAGYSASSSDGNPSSSGVVVSSASDVRESMTGSVVVSSANDSYFPLNMSQDMSINEVIVLSESDDDMSVSNSPPVGEVGDSSENQPNLADSTEGNNGSSASRSAPQPASDSADSKLPSSTSN